METPKYENRVPETPKNTQKTSEKLQTLQEDIEQNNVLNLIPKEELNAILEEHLSNRNNLNLETIKKYHDKTISLDEFKKILQNKNNADVMQFLKNLLKPYGTDYIITEIENIISSPEYKKFLTETRKLHTKNAYKEAFYIYNHTYQISGGNDAFRLQNALNFQEKDILTDKKFDDFRKNLESYFWEKIDSPHLLYSSFNNKTPEYNIWHTETGRKEIKKWIQIIRESFPDFSFTECVDIIFTHFDNNTIPKHFQTLIQSRKKSISILENSGFFIHPDNQQEFLKRGIASDYLNTFNENLEKYQNILKIFQKTHFAKNLHIDDIISAFQYNNHIYTSILNNTKTERFITQTNANNNNTGMNIMAFSDRVHNDIKDIISESPNDNETIILQNFEKFLEKQSDTHSIHSIFLSWNNFIKQNRKIEIRNNNYELIEKIKLLFPKNGFLMANNYGNLLEYKENTDLKKIQIFLEKLKANKNIDIDYIPHPNELARITKVENIIKTAEKIFPNIHIRLSDIFLVASWENIANIFQNENILQNIKTLADAYKIKIKDFRDISNYELISEQWDRITFTENSLYFNISEFAENHNFEYLIKNSSHIQSTILNNKNPLTLSDLKIALQFNNNELIVNNTAIVKKYENILKEMNLDDSDIRNLFSSTLSNLSENSTGAKGFLHMLATNEKQAFKMLEFAKNFSKNFTKKQEYEFSGFTFLVFLSDVIRGKSPYYKGNINDIKNELALFHTLGVQFYHSEEFMLYLRNKKYDTTISEIFKEKSFQNIFKNISDKYIGGNKNLTTALLSAEIFRLAKRKNNWMLEKLENGDFSEIENILKYFDEKYHIKSKHPFYLFSALHFADNFEHTKNLVSKLENLGEKIENNQLTFVSTVGKIISAHPEKEAFFFDKNQLISHLNKDIYTKTAYERPNVESITWALNTSVKLEFDGYNNSSIKADYENLKTHHTERAPLENLSLIELWKIYVTNEGLKNLNKKELKHYITNDASDNSTEFGGIISFDYNSQNKIESHFVHIPSKMQEDGWYSAGVSMHQLIPWSSFHFHALWLDNKDSSGPSGYGSIQWWDFGVSNYKKWGDILFTPIKWNPDGSIKINTDLYWIQPWFQTKNPDYSKFKIIDLGSETIK